MTRPATRRATISASAQGAARDAIYRKWTIRGLSFIAGYAFGVAQIALLKWYFP